MLERIVPTLQQNILGEKNQRSKNIWILVRSQLLFQIFFRKCVIQEVIAKKTKKKWGQIMPEFWGSSRILKLMLYSTYIWNFRFPKI